MERKNRTRRKNRELRKWLALFMATVLLNSESSLSVLAKEESGEEAVCICESKCSEDTVREDCPVCAHGYEYCIIVENVEEEADKGETASVSSDAEKEVSSVEGDSVSGNTSEEKRDEAEKDTGDVEGTTVEENAATEEDAGSKETEENMFGGVTDLENGAEANQPFATAVPDGTELLDEAEEEEIDETAVTPFANEGIEAYADEVIVISPGIMFNHLGNGEVEVTGLTQAVVPWGYLVIPETFNYNGNTYTVKSIGKKAFYSDFGFALLSVTLPDSIERIEKEAFYGCHYLSSINIPNGVTEIAPWAFGGCASITNIELPSSITSIGESAFKYCNKLESIKIPDGVECINDETFWQCYALKNVVLPNSIKSIGSNAFVQCRSLESIEIPNGVESIEIMAFGRCTKLKKIRIPSNIASLTNLAFTECSSLDTLQIVIPSGGEIKVATLILHPYLFADGVDVPFADLPKERSIIFLDENGTELTGDALEAAVRAYRSDTSDGDPTDDFWYGWRIGGKTTTITINVKKDDTDWEINERKFGLKPIGDPDAAMITDLTSTADGEYRIYDITDANTELDTGVTVTVKDGVGEPAEAINYYTVTFYDGSVSYPADTVQAPQIILKGQLASAPAEPTPSKPNHMFRWVTEDKGSVPFDFTAPIYVATSVYADWKADDYNITYNLDDFTAEPEDCRYTYGVQHVLPKPVKSDFVFDGWYENADYSGSKVDSIGTTETGDKIYYGRWTAKPVSAYRITITVQKNDEEWKDHGRKFMLAAEDGSMIQNLEAVSPGKYYIYDITEAAADALLTDGVNTGILVSVEDTDVVRTVDYYTVTFYDGAAAYGDDTPQAMQTVLKGKNAIKPENPSKTGYTFRLWTTTAEGSTAFKFEEPIVTKSSAYASWIDETVKEYSIDASAGEGGSISPAGKVKVAEGGEQTFEITPDEGYRIKSVTVDDTDRTKEVMGNTSVRVGNAPTDASRYFTFSNVRENHTIIATFETDNGGNSGSGDSGDNSGSGDSGDNSGSGDNGGNSGSGDNGGNSGSGDNGGNSGSGDNGGNSGSGDNGGNGDNSGSGDNGGNSGSGDNSGNGDNENGDNGSNGSGNDSGNGDNGGSGVNGDNENGGGSGSNEGSGVNGNGGNESGNDSNSNGNGNSSNGNSNSNGNATATGGGNGTDNNGASQNTGNTKDNGSVNTESNSKSADNNASSTDTEPKTGDTSHLEIYATIAMIAGLAYLLLYYADKKGITEDQKQEMVMRMIRWARRGNRLRKYVVLIPIFMLLFYYHSIGKRVCVEFDEQAT